MGHPAGGRVRRVEAAPHTDTEGQAPDYASAFAADLVNADALSAEEWARAIFEGAPRPLRWFVVVGWKLVLRLRLAPRGAAGAIAGWTTLDGTTPSSTALEVSSSLVIARKVVTVDAGRLTVATYVWFESKLGRMVWSSLAPVHHRIEPLLIRFGVRR